MNREIKFRAWDKVENRWIDPALICTNNNREIVALVDNNKDHHAVGKDLILMQYTGLKDKNGKDVWEGDIIKGKMLTDGETHYGKMVVEYGENTYDYGGFCIGFAGNGFYVEYEVIGNIYEHGHLLK